MRVWGLSAREQSTPLTWHDMQLSSSSLMTQFLRRRRQDSQGIGEWPFSGESESGDSRAPMIPGYASTWRLPWRLGGKRGLDGFGAMAMGAVRATALGVDMTAVIGVRESGSRFGPLAAGV